ncbi:MAG TPA: CBS domain-containing protein [Actinomycetota bacterium]|nr:CBS domain-containing protein [Actinomycetota bacterium]
MSPRAAWRLESLGFTEVYDYAAGKADWAAAGLPVEGAAAEIPRIGEAARKDVPTCGLGERIGEVRERVRAAGWDTCLVVNAERVVLGRLFRVELEGDADATAEQVMRPGPSTFRPNVSVEEMTRFMDERGITTAVVTTSDGRLVGLFRRGAARAG